MTVSLETLSDIPQTRAVHFTSFPYADEANLVDELRAKDSVYSLVAMQNETVVGHCMFSRMVSPTNTLGLGPVAVLPEFREQGVADQMIRAGLNLAVQDGWIGVLSWAIRNIINASGLIPRMPRGSRHPIAAPLSWPWLSKKRCLVVFTGAPNVGLRLIVYR